MATLGVLGRVFLSNLFSYFFLDWDRGCPGKGVVGGGGHAKIIHCVTTSRNASITFYFICKPIRQLLAYLIFVIARFLIQGFEHF